jgi:hypothetical protein
LPAAVPVDPGVSQCPIASHAESPSSRTPPFTLRKLNGGTVSSTESDAMSTYRPTLSGSASRT